MGLILYYIVDGRVGDVPKRYLVSGNMNATFVNNEYILDFDAVDTHDQQVKFTIQGYEVTTDASGAH